MFAPIALFTFRRPDHTKLVINSLLQNEEASNTEIFIYCDGPRNEQEEDSVKQVRNYVHTVKGFKAIHIIEHDKNYGLANSIISGVTEVLKKHENIIVLEDDIVTSRYFLRFMNAGLNKYKNYNQVASIHGFVYPVNQKLPNTFFLRGADCWGWATWRRAWNKFNPNGIELLNSLKNNDLIEDFDFHGAYRYSEMLANQIKGKNQSWAIRWHASMYLENMLTLYPGKSLVNNIGHDNSGTHSGVTNKYDARISCQPIEIEDIKIEVSEKAYNAFEKFMKKMDANNHKNNAFFKIKKLIKLIFPPIVILLYKKLVLHKLNNFEKNIPQTSDSSEAISFNGEYFTWDEAIKQCSGYESSFILDKVISSTNMVVSGKAVYERDSVLFDSIQYSWPVLAGLFLASSRSNGKLSVLDFGGALGSSYHQNKKFLNLLDFVEWNIIEQPNFVNAGNEYFKTDVLYFYDSLNNYVKNNKKPNVILLSSVLQYMPDPYCILKDLIQQDADVIIIDRTSYNIDSEIDLIRIQTVPDHIYSASYPCWFLNEKKLINFLNENNYLLIETFPALDNLDDRATWKGHIFYKNICG